MKSSVLLNLVAKVAINEAETGGGKVDCGLFGFVGMIFRLGS